MQHLRKLAAVLTLAALFAAAVPAEAAANKITCYNSKSGAKKVVAAKTCPAGYSRKAPRPASPSASTSIYVTAPFVKSMETAMAMGGTFMTGAFMQITNISDQDITLTSAQTAVAPIVQIHETVNGKMQERAGGLQIKAGTTEMLKPGGNHVMLMGMSKKLMAGDEVTLLLKFSNGATVKVLAPVKNIAGGTETYKPAAGMSM